MKTRTREIRCEASLRPDFDRLIFRFGFVCGSIATAGVLGLLAEILR